MVDLWIMSPTAARRDWLSRVVASDPELRIAGTATTFPYLRSLMSQDSADIALIELRDSSRDWLLELLELTPIVLLTAEPNVVMFSWLRRAGTGAMLQSIAEPDQVLQAIKSVALGLSVFDPVLIPSTQENDSPVEELTDRESEVLRLLAEGLGNRDIALKLNISEHTIKFHIHSILGKLGAASRTEAVTRGLRSGLIEL
jgi:DNA-binding NarL/FixJ family response regulator